MKNIILVCGFLVFASNSFAQNSNPDGIIGKPVITVLGGIGMGWGKSILWEDIYRQQPLLQQDADFTGFGLWGEITLPTSKSISLIFRFHANSQKIKYREKYYYKEELGLNSHGFILGIRFFGQ